MSMIFYVPRCRLKASTAVHCDAMAYFGRFMTVFGLTSYEWNDKEKGCLSHKKNWPDTFNHSSSMFPYSELVGSNDHHKPYNIKPSFNNYSI